MDIEKAAPVASRTPKAHAAAPAPRSRDSLDQLLDSEKDGSGRTHGDGGLGKVLAVSDHSPSSSAGSSAHESAPVSASGKAKAKHGHHAH